MPTGRLRIMQKQNKRYFKGHIAFFLKIPKLLIRFGGCGWNNAVDLVTTLRNPHRQVDVPYQTRTVSRISKLVQRDRDSLYLQALNSYSPKQISRCHLVLLKTDRKICIDWYVDLWSTPREPGIQTNQIRAGFGKRGPGSELRHPITNLGDEIQTTSSQANLKLEHVH